MTVIGKKSDAHDSKESSCFREPTQKSEQDNFLVSKKSLVK